MCHPLIGVILVPIHVMLHPSTLKATIQSLFPQRGELIKSTSLRKLLTHKVYPTAVPVKSFCPLLSFRTWQRNHLYWSLSSFSLDSPSTSFLVVADLLLLPACTTAFAKLSLSKFSPPVSSLNLSKKLSQSPPLPNNNNASAGKARWLMGNIQLVPAGRSFFAAAWMAVALPGRRPGDNGQSTPLDKSSMLTTTLQSSILVHALHLALSSASARGRKCQTGAPCTLVACWCDSPLQHGVVQWGNKWQWRVAHICRWRRRIGICICKFALTPLAAPPVSAQIPFTAIMQSKRTWKADRDGDNFICRWIWPAWSSSFAFVIEPDQLKVWADFTSMQCSIA